MSSETNGTPPDTPDLSRLAALIYVFGINKDIWHKAEEYLVQQPEEPDEVVDLASILGRLKISETGWYVLAGRFGFQKRLTLEAIAEPIGVTRARVQQTEQRVYKKLHENIHSVANAVLPLEKAVQEVWRELRQAASADDAIGVLQSLYEEAEDSTYDVSLLCLLLALRASVGKHQSGIENYLPHLTYLACSLPPVVVQHPRVGQEEAARQEQHHEATRTWKHAELITLVLEQAGEPLHYTTIFERAEELGKRENVTLKAVHNVLYSHTDKFAYVDQGTYGLTAWGLTSVDSYVNIIADVLKHAGKPLTYGDILHAVNAVRPIKEQSLGAFLSTHHRFYETKQKQFGLRAWLPPREKQTLRTPPWLVETPVSFERVARSAERGYDVAAIVAQDKE